MYKPKEIEQLNCAMRLLIPTSAEKVNGVYKKEYPNTGPLFFANFKTFGGTERDVNGVYSIEDTADIVTWYRPDIKSDCRVERLEDGAIFDIINEPEDMSFMHMYLKFKVKRVKGKV